MLRGAHTQVKTPFRHVQINPSTSNRRKTNIMIDAPTVSPENATAKGNTKIASTSKIKKTIA